MYGTPQLQVLHISVFKYTNFFVMILDSFHLLSDAVVAYCTVAQCSVVLCSLVACCLFETTPACFLSRLI